MPSCAIRSPVGNGDLSVGLIGSYLLHKEIAPSGGAVLDTAGEVGTASGFGMPDFKATLSVSYDIGDWGAFAQARYIGSGVYDATYGPEDLASSENDIGSVTYVDLSAHYDLNNLGNSQVTLFAGIDNAFDKDPPADSAQLHLERGHQRRDLRCARAEVLRRRADEVLSQRSLPS